MGMFDSIIFYCPDCAEEIEAQTKSGDGLLRRYLHTLVPYEAAIDCNRHAPFECPVCCSVWMFDEDIKPLNNKTDICHLKIERIASGI